MSEGSRPWLHAPAPPKQESRDFQLTSMAPREEAV